MRDLRRLAFPACFSACILAACSSTTTIAPSSDAGADSPSVPPGDSGPSNDAPSADATPAVCVPIGTQLADAGLVCAPRDGGGEGGADGGDICAPGSVGGFQPHWVPPTTLHQGKCTAAEIDLYRSACLGVQTDGGAACKSFLGSASGKACGECILPSTGTALGALVAAGGFVSPNVAGCIALAEPCNETCAHDVLAQKECVATACAACAKSATATTDDINRCEIAAGQCDCGAFTQKAACTDLLTGPDHPASQCLVTDFNAAYKSIATLFCGT